MNSILPHKHIDRSLLIRLGIFLIIGLFMLGILVRDVVNGELSVWYAVGGFALGIVVGYLLGRILRLKWHQTKKKAVMQMDIVGFLAIVLYFSFRYGEDWLFGHFLSGMALGTLSLSVLSGLLLGRLFGLRMSILKIVEENT